MPADEVMLAAIASQAERYLRWAVFLLACMFAILIVDLQLKKSVARQAMEASVMLGKARKYAAVAAQGLAADSAGCGERGGRGGDRVVRDAAGSAEVDGAEDQGAMSAAAAPDGAVGRPGGDGE